MFSHFFFTLVCLSIKLSKVRLFCFTRIVCHQFLWLGLSFRFATKPLLFLTVSWKISSLNFWEIWLIHLFCVVQYCKGNMQINILDESPGKMLTLCWRLWNYYTFHCSVTATLKTLSAISSIHFKILYFFFWQTKLIIV